MVGRLIIVEIIWLGSRSEDLKKQYNDLQFFDKKQFVFDTLSYCTTLENNTINQCIHYVLRYKLICLPLTGLAGSYKWVQDNFEMHLLLDQKHIVYLLIKQSVTYLSITLKIFD